MAHRASALNIARFCGLAPRLGENVAAGRAAAVSTALHAVARAANSLKEEDIAEAERLKSLLSEDELEDMGERLVPAVLACRGVRLDYRDAVTELEVSMDVSNPEDYEEDLCVGHLDAAWFVDGVAYVVDIKASKWTEPEGIRSLQLHAYGLAYAELEGADAYVVGLFFSDDGGTVWSQPVERYSSDWAHWEQAVRAAARNEEATTGAHCSECWQRLNCPHHLVKGLEESPLAIVSEGSSVTPERAAEALEWLSAAKNAVKVAEAALKAYAKANGGIPCSDGKVWREVRQAGRDRLDVKALREHQPEVAAHYTVKGPPISAFRKVKAR